MAWNGLSFIESVCWECDGAVLASLLRCLPHCCARRKDAACCLSSHKMPFSFKGPSTSALSARCEARSMPLPATLTCLPGCHAEAKYHDDGDDDDCDLWTEVLGLLVEDKEALPAGTVIQKAKINQKYRRSSSSGEPLLRANQAMRQPRASWKGEMEMGCL
eukprot:1159146-Pelagomonas_calceolata.AAC.1